MNGYYYYYGLPHSDGSDELYHHGTKGMHWYIRNYQNPDGSLTPLGRVHYGVGKAVRKTGSAVRKAYVNRHPRHMTNEELDARIERLSKETTVRRLEESSGHRNTQPGMAQTLGRELVMSTGRAAINRFSNWVGDRRINVKNLTNSNHVRAGDMAAASTLANIRNQEARLKADLLKAEYERGRDERRDKIEDERIKYEREKDAYERKKAEESEELDTRLKEATIMEKMKKAGYGPDTSGGSGGGKGKGGSPGGASGGTPGSSPKYRAAMTDIAKGREPDLSGLTFEEVSMVMRADRARRAGETYIRSMGIGSEFASVPSSSGSEYSGYYGRGGTPSTDSDYYISRYAASPRRGGKYYTEPGRLWDTSVDIGSDLSEARDTIRDYDTVMRSKDFSMAPTFTSPKTSLIDPTTGRLLYYDPTKKYITL